MTNTIIYLIIGSIVGTMFGLSSKIIFDWLKPKNGKAHHKIVDREYCPLDRADLIKDINHITGIVNHGKEINDKIAEKATISNEILKQILDILKENGKKLDHLHYKS